MRYGQQIKKRMLSVFFALVVIVGLAPSLSMTAKAEVNDTLFLGRFDKVSNTFEDALGNGTSKYNSLKIEYTSDLTTGESLNLPDTDNFKDFSKNDSLRDGKTTVISCGTEGKTIAEIVEYIKKVQFIGSCEHIDTAQKITITISDKVGGSATDSITSSYDFPAKVIYDTTVGEVDKAKVDTLVNGCGTLNINKDTAENKLGITATPSAGYKFNGIEVAEKTKTDKISFTTIDGTGDDGSSISNLFDNEANTTWQYTVSQNGNGYIIFKTADDANYVITDFTLSCDNESNWKGWSVYGGNFGSDDAAKSANADAWNIIGSYKTKSKNNNNEEVDVSSGTISNYSKYKYYKLVVDNKTIENAAAPDNPTPVNPIKMSGMTFKGYKVTSTISTTSATFDNTNDVMLIADFGQLPKLSYDLNGGTGNIPNTEYVSTTGQSVGVKSGAGITKEGYTFDGWTAYEKVNNVNKIYSTNDTETTNDNVTVSEDTVLYAVWKEKPSTFAGVTVSGYTGEYDGVSHNIEVVLPDNSDIQVTYSDTENGEYKSTFTGYKDVGEYTVYYKLVKDNEEKKGSAVIKINPRPITIIVNNMKKQYGDPDPTVDLTKSPDTENADYSFWGGTSLANGDRIDSITLTRESGEGKEKVGIYPYTGVSADIKNGDNNVNNNYSITYSWGTLSINKKVVTVNGITAKSKTYNGTSSVELDFSGATSWKIDGDNVGVTAKGTFVDKNAGKGKIVNITDIALTGDENVLSNYELASSGNQTTCTADINQKPVIVNGIEAANKVFDDTTTATLLYENVSFKEVANENNDAIVGEDKLSVTAVGAFADSSLGKDKTVNISNITLTGADAGNYVLAGSGQQTTCTASIVSSAITVSKIKAVDKVYDGTTDAELDCSAMVVTGIKDGDNVTVTATGKFVDKNVGDKKQVAITYTLSGSAKDNYAISSKASEAPRSATASITKKEVTVDGITVADKVYDGTTAATIDYSKATYGKIGDDDFVIASATGTFADKNAGDNKKVTVSGIAFSGSDASNYVLKSVSEETDNTNTSPVVEAAGNIKPCPVAVNGITVNSKVYDGTTDAKLDVTNASIDGKLEDDKLTFTASGVFEDKNVGSNKKVTMVLALSGDDLTNYVLSNNQSYTLSGDITAKEVVVSGIAAKSKNYDGSVEATLVYDEATLVGTDGKTAVIGEDELGVEAVGEFEDKNNGKDKKVYIKNLTLKGKDSANYILAKNDQQKACIADINGIPVAVSGITAKSKNYDGKTNAELDLSKAVLTGVDEGDKVYVSAVGEFEDAKAGNEKTVKLRSVQLTGRDAGNYSLVDTSQTECKAEIKPIAVTVSGITASNKEYDGNVTATLSFDNVKINGVLKSDKVSVTASGAFTDKYPGEGKDVIISDMSLTGQDAGNYVFAENGIQEKTTADITLTDGKISEESLNENGTKTIREVEYKDGQPTNKETVVTSDNNGVSLIEKNTYSDNGKLEQSIAFSVNSEREIYKMVVTDSEGNKIECTDETDVSYGNRNETVEDIKKNLEEAEITDCEKGSILDSRDISPDEMAFLLKDDGSTMELLKEAVNVGKTDGATGGANVAVAGFDGTLNTSKEEVLKQALTPTEIVKMLASAKTTDVVIEFTAEAGDNDKTSEAKQKIAELVNDDEDVFSFNCDMYKSVSGSDERIKLTELASKIGAGFVIPENLRGENRTYRLIGSHEDAATGAITASEIALNVDENYRASFTFDKLCLMSLAYTDDAIKERKISEQEAIEKEKAEHEEAEKAAAEKAQEEKEQAEKEAAEKEAAAKEQAEKEAAAKEEAKKELEKKADAMKEASDKEKAAREQAEKEAAAKAEAIKEINSKLVAAKKDIDSNSALDDTAKAEAKKIVDEAAASAIKTIESKGSTAKKSAVESFNNSFNKAITDGKNATDIRVRSTVTAEEMDKNSISINSGLKVVQKASVINVSWGKVDGAENYDVYVQYCGSAFLETPDTTLSSDVTSAEISMVGGKKLNLKKNYKIYVNAYRTVEGKKIVLAKTITAHVVGRKNVKYTNAKSITIKSAKTLDLDVNGVSVIKAKTNLVNKSKKKLTDAHAKEFRYASSDKKVATVSKSGVIKAVGSGTCTIYVYARNGYAKKIKVTVK